MRHRLYSCKYLLFLFVLLLFSGCHEEDTSLGHAPEILSPREGAVFFTGEAVRLKAAVIADPAFSHTEVFLNNVFLFESNEEFLDTLLPGQLFSEGSYTLDLDAIDAMNGSISSEVSFQFEHHLQESNNTESFGNDNIEGWVLSAWSPADIAADNDHRSLLSSGKHAMALTRKSFGESGSISFYVKNGAGNMRFLVDGQVKARWFGKGDWGYYAYTVPAGDHIFRWECETEGCYLDRVAFTPGLEQHTPGELTGGGTIFYLDSTGLHGLIAAFEDGNFNGNREIPWGCYGLNIFSGNRAMSTEDGAANTRAIVQDCSWEQIAARYCNNLVTAGDGTVQDDWYLPAVDELLLLYSCKEVLEGLEGQYYWTSTSFNSTAASVIDFRDGRHHGAHRNIPNITGPSTAAIHVRAIRKF